jgi:hypothetical protein
MRAIAGTICIIAVICFLGLPFIGLMIVFGLFYLLAQYAFGGNK